MASDTPAGEALMPTPDRRMDAYYYGFTKTGVDAIDKILSAVACAGKAYHHTEDWTNECEPYGDHRGETPADWIQQAANDAANALSRAKAEGAEEALKWLRKEVFALCEDTEEKYHPYGGMDSVQGAFSRGRCTEAKSIRNAIGEVVRERLSALPTPKDDHGR